MNITKKKACLLLCICLLLFTSTQSVSAISKTSEKTTTHNINSYLTSHYAGYHHYWAATPAITSFWNHNSFQVVCNTGKKVIIQTYNEALKFKSSITIPNRLPLYGNTSCDSDGNFYIVWGRNDRKNQNQTVICVVKYSPQGTKLGETTIRGYDSNPFTDGSEWGTQYPFSAGTCRLTIQNGFLACNYSRTMYNGHQSNFVFYIDCTTMDRIIPSEWSVPYCSHSFDQRIIGTSDGGYLVANQGDAYDRGFMISKVDSYLSKSGELTTFHFREGLDRSFGYNETYAQLGGIIETDNAYVLCACSERKLSLQPAPANRKYGVHADTRDLLIQILKKDFYHYTGADCFYTNGITRTTTGSAPSSSQTSLWLDAGTTDYGILWVTKLDRSHYVNNPKIVSVGQGQFVILWEELSYQTDQGSAYYMIMDENGSTLKEKTKIPNGLLSSDAEPVYQNGSIYWTDSVLIKKGTKIRLHQLTDSMILARTLNF